MRHIKRFLFCQFERSRERRISTSLDVTVLLSLMFILLLFSCNPKPEEKPLAKRVFPEYHYALDTIIKTNNGIIGGLELGQDKKLIPANQQKNAIDKNNDHLTYEEKIDSVSKYNITYSFENDSISEIEVLITSQNDEEGDKILNDLKNFYQQKYTSPLMDKGYYVFNCFDSQKRNFILTITDNGGSSGSIIDMLIYREK